jgi:hypothetical protein
MDYGHHHHRQQFQDAVVFLFTENVPSHVPSPSENTSLLTAE